jgi:hypothetical protein
MAIENIRDPYVLQMVEKLGEHYRAKSESRFVRPALLQISLEKSQWDLIDSLTRANQLLLQGCMLETLYLQLAAAGKLASLARRDLVPNIRNRIAAASSSSGPERVLRDMAVNAFGSNVENFSRMVDQIFAALVKVDKADQKFGRRPLYTQIPELVDLIRNLPE